MRQLAKKVWDEMERNGFPFFVKIGTVIIILIGVITCLIVWVDVIVTFFFRTILARDNFIDMKIDNYLVRFFLPVAAVWTFVFYGGSTFSIYLKKKKAAKAALEATEKEEDSG